MTDKKRYGIMKSGANKGDLTECKAKDKNHCPYHVPGSHEDLTPEEATVRQEKIAESRKDAGLTSLSKRRPRPKNASDTVPESVMDAYGTFKTGEEIINEHFMDDEWSLKIGEECYHHANGYMSTVTFNEAFPSDIQKDRYILLSNVPEDSSEAKTALEHWNDKKWMAEHAAASVESDDAKVYYTDFPKGYHHDDEDGGDTLEDLQGAWGAFDGFDDPEAFDFVDPKPFDNEHRESSKTPVDRLRANDNDGNADERKTRGKRKKPPQAPLNDLILAPALNDNNGYMGGHRFEGGKFQATKDLSRNEVAKLIRDDVKNLKSNGYIPKGWKVSVRQSSGSWSTGFSVGVTPSADAFRDPTWRDVLDGRAHWLKDDLYRAGMLSDENRFNEYMSSLSDDEKKKYRTLTPEAEKAYDIIEDASNQYGASDTNGMVDYFDYHRTADVSLNNENR